MLFSPWKSVGGNSPSRLDCPLNVAAVELGEALQCHQQSAIDSHRSLAMCQAARHSTAVRIVSVTTHHHMARPHPCSRRTHRLSATQDALHPFSQNCRPDSPNGEYRTFFNNRFHQWLNARLNFVKRTVVILLKHI